MKYKLKGSTVDREASQKERAKNTPTYKDNDFLQGTSINDVFKNLQINLRILLLGGFPMENESQISEMGSILYLRYKIR